MDSDVKDIFELDKETTGSRGLHSLTRDAIIGGVKVYTSISSHPVQ